MGTWYFHNNSESVQIDEKVCSLLGLPSGTEEISFRDIVPMLPSESRLGVFKGMKRALLFGKTFEKEIAIMSVDGTTKWLGCRGRMIGKSENARKFFGVAFDITSQKQMEKAFRATEKKYRYLMLHAPTGIYELDLTNLRFKSVNDAMCELLGYTRDELFSLNPLEIMAEESRIRFIEHHKNYLLGEDVSLELEIQVYTKSGKAIWAHLNAKLTRDSEGNAIAFVVAHDITQRKAIEEQMRAKERSLCEADRQKDEFLAILGHELRNPLGALQHGLEILKQSEMDNRQHDRARTMMEQQIFHITNLVDDLLDLTRISEGKITLHKKDIKFVSIVETIHIMLSPSIRQKAHNYTYSIDPQDIVIHADPARVEQVLVNLLTNAIKYTDRGGCIDLKATRLGQHVAIDITDNGIGLTQEQQKVIFDPFNQVKIGYGGLGIGLTVARRLSVLQGGDITVTSAGLGKGCTFTVTFPLSCKQPGDDLPQVISGEGAAVIRGVRLLLVDDNEAALWGFSIILDHKGCMVKTAVDGKQAIATARDFRPDIILLDIGLPDMDGFAVFEELKKESVCPSAKVIAVTGYADASTSKKIHTAGFTAHFLKPIDTSMLFEFISHYISEKNESSRQMSTHYRLPSHTEVFQAKNV
jgi:PAS domain S-box-containing protein